MSRDRRYRRLRSVREVIFRWIGFSVMAGCLLLVAGFLWRLGADGAAWYRAMPTLIAARNAELEGELKQLEHAKEEELATLKDEMETELAAAATDDERAEFRTDYENKIIPAKLATLQQRVAEKRIAASQELRLETSKTALTRHFLTSYASDNNSPQNTGIYAALLGTLYISLITILAAVPVGVGAAVYLEEYGRNNWFHRLIRINIQNLAAVPAVFYGILGAFVFVEMVFKRLEGTLYTPMWLKAVLGAERADQLLHAVFGEQIAARNLLGGGLTLALLTLPVIIVASQEALRAVPSSLRHASLALGATRWQTIWHHVLPEARGGILTGVILALSRAMGEASPLVMFGALLYTSYDPRLFDRFTVVPMQIFAWMDRPSELWRYNAALASIFLLLMLFLLNGVAVVLRYRARRIA